jgi:sodium/hydrogen exchanger-like protein 6/7
MAGIDILGYFSTIIMLSIIIYSLCSSAILKYKIKYIHESGVAILLGIIISYIVSKTSDAKIVSLDHEIFLYVFLPPIIFAEGFNMRKRKIFANMP